MLVLLCAALKRVTKQVIPPSTSATYSTVTVNNASIASSATSTITLHAYDSGNNALTTGGATVVFGGSGGTSTGTLGAVTDVGNGTYTCVFTGVVSGTARTISATINGVTVATTMPTITVTPGTIDRTTSLVTLAVTEMIAGGSTVLVTLTAKDANSNLLTSGGSTVVFSHTGGTSIISISATTDVTNGTYTALVTPTTAGTATTMSATIGGLAVTTTMPTFTVLAVSGTLQLEEDFSTYSSPANMKTNPRGIYTSWSAASDGNENYNINQITLDQTDGYGSLTQCMRYDFPLAASSYTVGVNLLLPAVLTTAWVEVIAKFTDFTTNGPGAGNADYKFVFGRLDISNRFNLMVGTFGTPGVYTWGYPAFNDSFEGGSCVFNDGAWHTYRMKMGVGPTGSCKLWVDGSVVKDYGSVNINIGTYGHIWSIALGRNNNKGQSQTMTLKWGRVRVYSTDPGW